MNQGSSRRHSSSNGPRQDGALLAHLEERNRWVAVFLAFQSQRWDTDPRTGDPLREARPDSDIDRLHPAVSVVAAMINAVGKEEGAETVTIFNRTDAALSLNGWRIIDIEGRHQMIDMTLGAGETAVIRLEEGSDKPRLANRGGTISLVTADGAVAHSVSYSKSDAAREGWATVF